MSSSGTSHYKKDRDLLEQVQRLFFFCPETKMMRVTGLSLLLGKAQEAGPVQLGEKKA